MPIYEYKCSACDHRFSLLQRIGEGNEHVVCEKCGAPKPVKQFSTFASTGGIGGEKSFATSSAPSGSPFT
jgi:putative FmdB family regulatory protein